MVRNCHLTVDGAKRVVLIYGGHPTRLQGHKTKSKIDHVPTYNPISPPPYVIEQHRNITLCANILAYATSVASPTCHLLRVLPVRTGVGPAGRLLN